MISLEDGGTIEIGRETSPGSNQFQTLDINSRTYDRNGNLLEEDYAPLVPFPLGVPSRVILLGRLEKDSERIFSSDPVDAEVIAVIPGLITRPVIINNRVNKLTDPEEVMRALSDTRALLRRSSSEFTVEADFRMLLRYLPEAFNHKLPIPLGSDLMGRAYRASIFEVDTGHSRFTAGLPG